MACHFSPRTAKEAAAKHAKTETSASKTPSPGLTLSVSRQRIQNATYLFLFESLVMA
jgi:hypothetical protein